MTDLVFVLNGPNLNLLGTREPRIYGTQTLDDIRGMMEQRAKRLKLTLDVRQSNHEGVIVDWLQEAMAKASAVVINAGAYAHSSIAIRDAGVAPESVARDRYRCIRASSPPRPSQADRHAGTRVSSASAESGPAVTRSRRTTAYSNVFSAAMCLTLTWRSLPRAGVVSAFRW